MPLHLRCPKFDQGTIEIPKNIAQLSIPFNGSLCSDKGEEYTVKKNIVDLLEELPSKLSAAEWSNHLTITAKIYEDLWRKRSLGILSGDDFPIEREQELLYKWTQPKPNDKILDVGCSSAFYARTLKKKQSSADVYALDFSKEMLLEARAKAVEEQSDLFLIRANALDIPFFSNSFDLIVCGGSLNEFKDARKVMYETHRVLKQDGKVFVMHLLTSDSWYGKLLQQSISIGGISFWTAKESNQLFEQVGFKVVKQETYGIVCFSLLEKY